MRSILFGAASALAVLTSLALVPGTAAAQVYETPPVFPTVDGNGVNVVSGEVKTSLPVTGVGSGGNGLSIAFTGLSKRDSYTGTITAVGGTLMGNDVTWYTVSLGDHSQVFFRPVNTNVIIGYAGTGGDNLAVDTTANVLVYTTSDGSVARFSSAPAWQSANFYGLNPVIVSLTKPSGERLDYYYRSCGDSCSKTQSIVSTAGYMLKYQYDDSNQLTKVVAIDTSIDYCDPTSSADCATTKAWPTATLTYNADGSGSYVLTDSTSRAWTVGVSSSKIVSIKAPSGAGVDFSYNSNSKIQTSTNGGAVWNYAYSGPTTVTDPLGHAKKYYVETSLSRVYQTEDALLNKVRYSLAAYTGLVTDVTNPEGGVTTYSYTRGNVTKATSAPKTGYTDANIVVSSQYETTCSNYKTCNQPQWTKDALGNQTDYTYDATHGGVLTVTRPAGADNKRPQDRYSYAQYPTYSKNSAGQLVQTGSVWRLASIASCITGETCSTTNEVKTTYAYSGPHALLASTTQGAGDGSLSATTTSAYNDFGDIIAIDGPAAGSDDTTTYRYDSARRSVGMISPDPDGAGVQKRTATSITYDVDGRPVITAKGTVEGTSDADWAAMSVLQRGLTVYDTNGQVKIQATEVNGTIIALTQNTYDAAGRLTCSAQRLNPAKYGAYPQFTDLPASACTPGDAGADGPDRISYTVYDAADRVIEEWEGYGTSSQVRAAKYTLSADGLTASATDANDNTTAYTYDGFGRPKRTYYPVATLGALTASTTDYEEETLDAAGQTIQSRRRDGQVFGYTYDALGRVTVEDAPGSMPDTSYVYDNLGRTTSITQSGQALSFTYDALGRQLSEASAIGTVSSQYDILGRRTRITWPGDFYVTYEYEALGGLKAVRENGSTLLASYEYDALWRRSKFIRGDGAVTTYSYDAALRLSSMDHQLGGYGQTYGLTYAQSGQIKSRTATTGAYTTSSNGAATRTYIANGLNQFSSAAGQTLSYDARGNLTGDGTTTYAYDVNNKLTGSSGGATLAYDAVGRLASIAQGGATTSMLYDDDQLIAEYSGSTVLRRYVPGAGGDEPLVWYEYAGGATTKRWYAADERGSIVAVLNAAGSVEQINTYDEYGVPGATNLGRYQYTGQTWMSEIGAYNYKARVYSPTLGRFLQPDPAGYIDGLNLYAYVGGDPVNNTDPSGMWGVPGTSCIAGSAGCDGNANFGQVLVGASNCAYGAVCLSGIILDLLTPPSPPANLGGALVNLTNTVVSFVTPSDLMGCSAAVGSAALVGMTGGAAAGAVYGGTVGVGVGVLTGGPATPVTGGVGVVAGAAGGAAMFGTSAAAGAWAGAADCHSSTAAGGGNNNPGKSGKHTSQARKSVAQKKYEEAQAELERKRLKPNKTKEEAAEVRKLKQTVAHWKAKADATGENHWMKGK